MNYEEIFKNYHELRIKYKDCQDKQKEEHQKLILNIRKFLAEKSFKEYSKYYSELYELWYFTKNREYKIDTYVASDKDIQKKYIEYRKQTSSISALKTIDLVPLDILIKSSESVASREFDSSLLDKENDEDDVMRRQEAKFFEFSYISNLNKPYEAITLIENLLSEVWFHIFQDRLNFLSKKNTVSELAHVKKDEYFHHSWSLYELLNQISQTINQTCQDGKCLQIKISTLDENKRDDVISNTEEVCDYILNNSIITSKKKNNSLNWFPALEIYKDTTLPHIIATADHVSYMFGYILMTTKKKNTYLKKISASVETIYNDVVSNNTLYDAIESYINKYDRQDVVIEYNNHIFSPKIVLTFIISIFQEVIRNALTKSYSNIFYSIDKRYRDNGLSENTILNKIKKDAESYTLIYNYLEKPTHATKKKKEEKLKCWGDKLNKLRFGVLDDYLFDLSRAVQISFEESTITSIKL